MYKVGVLTVSDRCSRGEATDRSGPNLVKLVPESLGQKWNVVSTKIVPDEVSKIKSVLQDWAFNDKLSLILTTGGTGFSPRDVTPEATKSVIEREAPGLVHAMVAGSLSVTSMAMLSRPAAGIVGRTLIVNLPGSSKGSAENFEFVVPALKHGIDVLLDLKGNVEAQHNSNGNGAHQAYVHVCPHKSEGKYVPADIATSSNVAQRPRQSPFPMISVKEAQKIVLDHCKAINLGVEVVPFNLALGRVLAEGVLAAEPLPPFPASIKDGYAVISSDGAGVRQVVGASNAGNEPGQRLQSGQCIRINTGAPVPDGADCVIQVEDTKLVKATEDGREELEVEILKARIKGHDIRPVGSDIETGSIILPKGSAIGPAEVGLLATVGAIEVKVHRKPTVALLSTGNELQTPHDGELKPGYIRDSNKSTLLALIGGEQGFKTVDCGIAPDDLDELKAKLASALDQGDLVVTTGGVSMGDRDLLRQVLVQDFKAKIHFGRVHMKPGKPTTFATLTWKEGQTKLVLGLPGNPVSATVTTHLYVLPACRSLSGFNRAKAGIVKARLNHDVRLDPRPEYMRVALSWHADGDPVASTESTGNQISSRLASLRAANALLMLPPRSDEVTILPKNTICDAMIIGPLLQF